MIRKIIAAAALAACAASSYAAEPGSVYAGVDAGTTRLDGNSTKSSYGGFLGYQVLPNIAIEGAYRDLGHTDLYGVRDKTGQYSLSLVGSYPVTEALSLYGRLGVSRISHAGGFDIYNGLGEKYKLDYRVNKARLLPGIGASYKLTQKVSARVELQLPDNNSTNLSAGLSYSF
jgi:OOP family OmpA-OmpF porin